MKTLLLLRHGKSSRNDPNLSDHQRPLKKRGRRDCRQIGELLVSQQLVPNLIVSSTAERARTTAECVAEHSGYHGACELRDELYLASPESYVDVLRQLDDRYRCVLVVGHNPGLEELVELLSGQMETLPTAALARFELQIERWEDLQASHARLTEIWRPKELDA